MSALCCLDCDEMTAFCFALIAHIAHPEKNTKNSSDKIITSRSQRNLANAYFHVKLNKSVGEFFMRCDIGAKQLVTVTR